MRDGAVTGMNFTDKEVNVKNCETCAVGKQCRAPFKGQHKISTGKLDLIDSDLVGPMETLSFGKAKYLLTSILEKFSVIFYRVKKKFSINLMNLKYF